MKINLTCPTCRKRFHDELDRKYGEHRSGSFSIEGIDRPENIAVDLVDRRFYEIRCSEGHITNFVLQQQRFETLFDLGACAIYDGYPREAILSFVGSIERFYQFWFRCIMKHYEVPSKEASSSWNMMAKQSERQIGAFTALYVREFKKKPKIMDPSYYGIRNNVAHNGFIPTRHGAIEFGEYVLGLLKPLVAELHENYTQAVRLTILETNKEVIPAKLDEHQYLTLQINTLIKAEPNEDTMSLRPLEEQLSAIKYRWSDWGKQGL